MKLILYVSCLFLISASAFADVTINGASLNSLRTQSPATKAVLSSEIPKIQDTINSTLTLRFKDPVPGSIRDSVAKALRNLQASLNSLFPILSSRASLDSSNLVTILQLVDSFSLYPGSGVTIDQAGNYVLTGEFETFYYSTSMPQGVTNGLAVYDSVLVGFQQAINAADSELSKLPQGNSNVKLGVETANLVYAKLALISQSVKASRDLMESAFPH